MKNSKISVDVTFGTKLWVKTCFSVLTKVGSKSLGRNEVSTIFSFDLCFCDRSFALESWSFSRFVAQQQRVHRNKNNSS